MSSDKLSFNDKVVVVTGAGGGQSYLIRTKDFLKVDQTLVLI